MGARFEMIQLANRSDAAATELRKECERLRTCVQSAEDEVTRLQTQLKSLDARLEAAQDAGAQARDRNTQLQDELAAIVEAAQARECELQAAREHDVLVLQTKFEKAKRELLDTMAQNLNLDGRLKKAQEKIARMASTGAGGSA